MPRSSPDAAQWLSAARGGSREALGRLLEACRDYLLLVANQELDVDLRAKGGASDLVQQTFLEAQRDFGAFQGASEEELLAWLRRLLVHNLADFARRYRGTGKRRAEREVALEGDSAAAGPAAGLAADTPSPSGRAVAREEDEGLERALARLPEDYRTVIVLRYREERSFEEIGQLIDRSPNAARKLWLRAVERLRAELEGSP
ncbi:MAG TPA: sigma-70 family RNA polymerase sigma factor [Gemmataceae bacterium]|nr:sigma-70 family RNA polymerase sigma factor [Gemmataceae bacterium]